MFFFIFFIIIFGKFLLFKKKKLQIKKRCIYYNRNEPKNTLLQNFSVKQYHIKRLKEKYFINNYKIFILLINVKNYKRNQ